MVLLETIHLNSEVILVGLLGAIPFVLAARRYKNMAPMAVYTVMLLGTATVLGAPHSYRTTLAGHGFVAGIGLTFLWFTYNGHKQVEHIRSRLQEQGMVRVK